MWEYDHVILRRQINMVINVYHKTIGMNIQLGVNIRILYLGSHSGRQNWSLQLDQYKGTFW